MVRATTLIDGHSLTMRAVASSPFMRGMLTSMTTTSGCSVRPLRTASRPSAASPTTSMSASASRMARSPCRTIV